MGATALHAVTNLAGRGATALISLVTIPLYLYYLGIDAFGLVTFLGVLQSLANLLDLGVSATLNREMARLSANEGERNALPNCVRSLEVPMILMALAVALLVFLSAPLIAERWLETPDLPVDVVTNALRVMACIVAVQLLFGFYLGGLMGLGRQVAANGLSVATALLRAVGAVLLLHFVSRAVTIFLLWHAAALVVGAIGAGARLYRAVPSGMRGARCDWQVLRASARYAAGWSGSAVARAAFSQSDKLLLSALLPVGVLGTYGVAQSLANAVWMVVHPLSAAVFPRFTALVAQGRHELLRGVYHLSMQAVAALLAPLVALLTVMPVPVLWAWTGDRALAEVAAPLLIPLTVGAACNALVNVPIYLQLAHGDFALSLRMTVLLGLLALPLSYLLVTSHGAPGAALAWMLVNVTLTLILPLMHRRYLPGALAPLLLRDVGAPLLVSAAVVLLAHSLGGALLTSRFAAFALVAMGGMASVVASILVCRGLRRSLLSTVRGVLRRDEDQEEGAR